MSYDNRIFNVNGQGLPMLQAAIQLAVDQEEGFANGKIYGWAKTEHGLTFLAFVNMHETQSKAIPFPVPIGAVEAAKMAFEWLKEPHPEIKFEGEDSGDIDIDGSVDRGWRVSLESPELSKVICTVRPVFLWYGK